MSRKQTDPLNIFNEWFEQAKASESDHADAATLATSDRNGMPHARIVLVKVADQNGFTFFTNLGSAKSVELQENPRAALCFHWKTRKYQVRVEGTVQAVSAEEADRYFATRPRLSQIGAWASKQSQPLEGDWDFESALAKYTAKFGAGEIPRPPFWSGFRILPIRIEFWEERPFRLHKRRSFTEQNGRWLEQSLFP
jgi:pyridoxamine 5'-phosphate oxidase